MMHHTSPALEGYLVRFNYMSYILYLSTMHCFLTFVDKLTNSWKCSMCSAVEVVDLVAVLQVEEGTRYYRT
jgi:hypothetical protein